MNYQEFLQSKTHSSQDFGMNPVFMPDAMFDYQKFIAERIIRKGRHAGFLDTGTGKTIIELVNAVNFVRHTNKRVLIITPLAVAFQFVKEAAKFGIDDVSYSKDGSLKSKIVIANYDRLQKFNPSDFDCVILDESSILKNFEGAIKNTITSFLKKVKYRSLYTATPSPNDFVELGTSSEALGYLGYTDMLTRFFTNNEDTIKPQNIGTKWILKGHARENFFKWVSTWSISMRRPSDLGFSNERFILPNLITNSHSVNNEKPLVVDGQYQLFNIVARSMKEMRSEGSLTVEKRCEKAVEVTESHETSVYWCNINKEGDLLSKLDKSAVQITGSMNIDQKEEILEAFGNGEIKRLITKPTITAFGLNWQHCNHTTYFPTYSYEQYYQAIRRFHRYGQKNDVIVDLIHSDGQGRLLDSLFAKAQKADETYSMLNSALNQSFEIVKKEANTKFQLPSFL